MRYLSWESEQYSEFFRWDFALYLFNFLLVNFNTFPKI